MAMATISVKLAAALGVMNMFHFAGKEGLVKTIAMVVGRPEFLKPGGIFTTDFATAQRVVPEYLKQQLPQFNTPEMQMALGELKRRCQTSGLLSNGPIVSSWVAQRRLNLGQSFEIPVLSREVFDEIARSLPAPTPWLKPS